MATKQEAVQYHIIISTLTMLMLAIIRQFYNLKSQKTEAKGPMTRKLDWQ